MARIISQRFVVVLLVGAGIALSHPAHAQWFTNSEWFSSTKKADPKPTAKKPATTTKKAVAKKPSAQKTAAGSKKATTNKKTTKAKAANAKPKTANKNSPPQKTAPKQNVAKASGLPDSRRMHLLIVSSIIAADQANKTGNYSVLQKLAAPGFQKVNSPEKLKEIFAALRKRNLDLTPIILYPPKLLRKAHIDDNGLLRLTGFFDTRPERVLYDTAFRKIGDDWKLFGISLNTRPAKVAAKKQTQAPTQKQPAVKTSQ